MAGVVERRIHANRTDFNVAIGAEADEGAPAVVFLDGFPESWIAWRPVMDRLEGVRTFAPDLAARLRQVRAAGERLGHLGR